MLTKEQAADVFDRIRRFSSADEVEAIFTGSRFALTRFANNTIHQNQTPSFRSAPILPAGRRALPLISLTTKVCSGQSPLPRISREYRRRTRICCRCRRRKKRIPGTRSRTRVSAPHVFSTRLQLLRRQSRGGGQEHRVHCRQARADDGGHLLDREGSSEGIFNSRGLANWHHQSLAEISITMLAEDSSGWQKLNSPDVRKLDPARLAETAAQKAVEFPPIRERLRRGSTRSFLNRPPSSILLVSCSGITAVWRFSTSARS